MDILSKCTPGDWKVFTTVDTAHEKRLLVMAKTSPESEESEIVYDAGQVKDEQAHANAMLAVAAKDLYAAGLELKHIAGPLDLNVHAGEQGPVVIPWRVYAALMAAVDKVPG